MVKSEPALSRGREALRGAETGLKESLNHGLLGVGAEKGNGCGWLE